MGLEGMFYGIEKMAKGAATWLVVIFVLIGLGVLWLLWLQGGTIADLHQKHEQEIEQIHQEWRMEVVDKGCGHWTVDDRGKASFKWGDEEPK